MQRYQAGLEHAQRAEVYIGLGDMVACRAMHALIMPTLHAAHFRMAQLQIDVEASVALQTVTNALAASPFVPE
jgi:hypothetical protein